jgi:uncharacterized protein YbjT (DUF2867 family)
MSPKRIIIVGATGMVGGCALRICLEKSDVSGVTGLGRRTTGRQHPKLREVVHDNFLDFSSLGDALKGHDLALYCLGAYTGAVPDDEFRRITADGTLAFAKALKAASPRAAVCFLSGQGADQTERSRVAFARYKGMAENGLIAAGFPRVHIFRPGYIYPVTPRKEPNLLYDLFRRIYPVLRFIYPNIGISSEDLARAMVMAGLYGTGEHQDPILENRDIRMAVNR